MRSQRSTKRRYCFWNQAKVHSAWNRNIGVGSWVMRSFKTVVFAGGLDEAREQFAGAYDILKRA